MIHPLKLKSDWAGIYAVAGAIACGIYLVLPSGLKGYVYFSFAFVAAATCAARALFAPRDRGVWVLLAVSLVSYGSADALYGVLSHAYFPGPADVGYLIGLLLALCAAIAWRKDSEHLGERSLEAGMLATALAVIVWIVWLHPIAHVEGVSDGAQVIALAYPFLDLTLVALIVSGGRLVGARRWCVAAAALLLAGDVFYARASLAGTYSLGDPHDLLWLGSYVAFGAAAIAHGGRQQDPRPLHGSRALVFVSLWVPPSMLLYQVLTYERLHIYEVALSALLLGPLVMWRFELFRRRLLAALRSRDEHLESQRQTNELFTGAFSESQTAMALTDLTGSLILVNEAMCRVTGYDKDELLAMDLHELTDAEGWAAATSHFGPIVDFPLDSSPLEMQLISKTRNEVWAEVVVSVIHDAGGRPEWLLAQARDITAEKRATELAERLLRQHRSILDSTADGIIGVDPAGKGIFGNPAAVEMFGFELDDLIGADLHGLVHHSHKDGEPYDVQDCPIHRSARDGRKRLVTDEVMWRRNGTSFHAEYTASPMVEKGEVTGVVVSIRDVTQERALEEQSRHSQKMEALGSLAGGIAHDFNNLLFVIRSSGEFLSSSLDQDVEGAADLVAILDATDRASSLVQKLLTFSRREVSRPVDLDLGSLLDESEDFLRRALPETVALEVSTAEDLWPTLIDRVHAEQILLNLVVNARDAMPEGGDIVVRLSNTELRDNLTTLIEQPDPGHYLCLQVSDTGSGIPEDLRRRIFEPFFSTKGSKGTGLGLATVYGIVRDAGGAIAVDSSDLGTTFRVFLPASSAAAGSPAPVDPADVPIGRGELILLVEDESAVSAVVTKMLEGGGYRVVPAGGAEEGLDTFRKLDGIRLVLTDIVMPDGSGIDLAETVRRESDVPILLMSGYSDQLASQELLGPDVTNFLQKPFSAHDLCAKVGAMLSLEDPTAAALFKRAIA